MATNFESNPARRYRWALSWLPITLQPKLLSLKNSFLKRRAIRLADLIALAMTALLMAGLYYGTRNTLRELSSSALSADATSSMLYGFSLGLFGLIFVSAVVTGISNLFMARDVNLLLAAPISHITFLRSKALEVLVSTTWMIVVFSIPPYVAFGQRLNAGVEFFTIAPLYIALYLLVAVLAGMNVAICCAAILPARTGRNIFVALFVIVLGVVIALVNASPDHRLYTHLLKQPSHPVLTETLTNPLLPSAWLSNALLTLSAPSATVPLLPLTWLLLSLAVLWSLLMVSFKLLYSRGYSRLHTQPRAYILLSRAGKPRRRLFTMRSAQAARALAARELCSFGRDLTHTVQLAIFLTICILYFINFQNISAPTRVGTWVLRAWDLMAIFSFIIISSLIILSICSRFVFPSVSLEGSSLWILQVAPVSPRSIIRAKYFTWAVPTGIVCAVLFASAGLALALEPLCILMLGLSACAITHGFVSLGIGMGAQFSRFDWEHPAELSASWGSLAFLLAGLATLAINLIPLGITFGCYVFYPALFENTNNLLALFSTGLGVLLLFNVIVGKIALKLGVSALTRVFAA
jgi:ABC-2 type transport system permease protein